MKVKITLVYTDNSIVDLMDYENYENIDKLCEALLNSFKQNNGLGCVGNEYIRTLINLSHVKHVIIEKCE